MFLLFFPRSCIHSFSHSFIPLFHFLLPLHHSLPFFFPCFSPITFPSFTFSQLFLFYISFPHFIIRFSPLFSHILLFILLLLFSPPSLIRSFTFPSPPPNNIPLPNSFLTLFHSFFLLPPTHFPLFFTTISLFSLSLPLSQRDVERGGERGTRGGGKGGNANFILIFDRIVGGKKND